MTNILRTLYINTIKSKLINKLISKKELINITYSFKCNYAIGYNLKNRIFKNIIKALKQISNKQIEFIEFLALLLLIELKTK